ncbi:TAXI family TRAP transporter solute-binding subunit [Thalassospira mesophila]|nr:TAXI family TRAP transporter solute-binding subunit [Thalassospira mesophila]
MFWPFKNSLLASVIVLVCAGPVSLAYAQGDNPAASSPAMAPLANSAAIEEASDLSPRLSTQQVVKTNIDQFDDQLLQTTRDKSEMINGLIYKPDAIPLSQYRQDYMGVGGVTQQISEDGDKLPSYYIAIYSGSTSGVYFQVAAKICELMRQTYAEHRVHCVPLRSQGVGSNIELMKEGRVQVAIVQSNTNWEAQNGVNPIPGARSVMSLHDEMGLLVVRKDAGIHSIADLRNKRINIGPEGSASRALWLQLLKQYNIGEKDLGQIYGVAQDYNGIGICGKYIDAFGLWIGHPAPPIQDTLGCNATVVGMGGAPTEELVRQNSYFFNQVLPANTYEGQDKPIKSFGFKASLIAYEPANPYVIYWLTRIVHEHLDDLRKMMPMFSSVTADDMFTKGNFLPFHKGAACYWETDKHACDWQTKYVLRNAQAANENNIINLPQRKYHQIN